LTLGDVLLRNIAFQDRSVCCFCFVMSPFTKTALSRVSCDVRRYMFDVQVTEYRRRRAANVADLATMTRERRALASLSNFYRCLCSEWDTFMIQFHGPNHHINSHTADRHNTRRWNSQSSGMSENNERCRRSDKRAVVTGSWLSKTGEINDIDSLPVKKRLLGKLMDTDVSPLGHLVPKTGSCRLEQRKHGCVDVVSVKVEAEDSACVGSVTRDTNAVARLPVKKRQVERPRGSRNVSRHHSTISTQEGVNREQRKHGSKMVSFEANVKCRSVMWERQTGRLRRFDNNVTDDAKSVFGKNIVEIGTKTSRARFGEHDVKPDSSSVNVIVDESVHVGCDVVVVRRSRRLRKSDGDMKCVVGISKTHKSSMKQKSTPNTNVVEKNGVVIIREIAWTGFEEQDLKLNVADIAVTRRRSKPKLFLSHGDMSSGVQQPSAAVADVASGCAASSEHFVHSPPFSLLSPSQIKVEAIDIDE